MTDHETTRFPPLPRHLPALDEHGADTLAAAEDDHADEREPDYPAFDPWDERL